MAFRLLECVAVHFNAIIRQNDGVHYALSYIH